MREGGKECTFHVFLSPGNGVRISENRMMPSGLKERKGCSVISVIRSVVSERTRKDGNLTAKSRYTFW